MKVRAYVQHIRRINNEELPNLPPFAPDQGLTTEELLDIILFGTPKAWQREMDRQGMDPMLNSLANVLNFMENIEAAEAFGNGDKKPPAKNEKGKKQHPSQRKDSKSNTQVHSPWARTLYGRLQGYASRSQACQR